MDAGSRIVLLAEDQTHQVFFRRFLREMGVQTRRIRTIRPPHGDGAGDQHVREQFPERVKWLRSRSYQTNLGLLVVIDGDELDVRTRKQELDDALLDDGLRPRDDDDPIAIVVPNRNIETWIHSLRGHEVDETTNYKSTVNLGRARNCRDEADTFVELYRLPDEQSSSRLSQHPPSMLDAFEELKRLP